MHDAAPELLSAFTRATAFSAFPRNKFGENRGEASVARCLDLELRWQRRRQLQHWQNRQK